MPSSVTHDWANSTTISLLINNTSQQGLPITNYVQAVELFQPAILIKTLSLRKLNIIHLWGATTTHTSGKCNKLNYQMWYDNKKQLVTFQDISHTHHKTVHINRPQTTTVITYKQSFPKFGIRKLGSQLQTLITNVVFGPLIPRKQNCHLERRHLQIKSTNVIGKCYLTEWQMTTELQSTNQYINLVISRQSSTLPASSWARSARK